MALVVTGAALFSAGCDDVSFNNGTEVVWIDGNLHVIRCQSSGQQILPRGGGSVVELAPIKNSDALVARIGSDSHPLWSEYAIVWSCDDLEVFSWRFELNARLVEHGIDPVSLQDFEATRHIVHRGGFRHE